MRRGFGIFLGMAVLRRLIRVLVGDGGVNSGQWEVLSGKLWAGSIGSRTHRMGHTSPMVGFVAWLSDAISWFFKGKARQEFKE